MLKITFDSSGARALLQRLKARVRNTEPLMADIAENMLESVQRNFEAGGRPDKWKASRSEKTLVDNAVLKNSFTTRSSKKEAQVGTRDKRAPLLHFGGVVKPKRAKALAIPLQDYIKRGPRHYDLFFIESKKGKKDTIGILAKKRGDTVVPMFALRRKVTIPARPFLLIQDEDEAYARARVREFISTGRLS